MSADPVLHLVAGPNGAGKSTLWKAVVGFETGLPFVNADQLAGALWPAEPWSHSDDARRKADMVRDQFILEHRSFGTETVFSHESRLDFVRTAVDAGYLVTLHVLYVDPDTAVARVAGRVELGGHGIAEDKIRSRHPRIWGYVAEAIRLVEDAVVYDNRRRKLEPIARFHRGKLTSAAWPDGFPAEITSLSDEPR